jgi:NAD(P)-dependent dehydrogenase (short-subunit alcohol dehydrogenase family)
MHFLVWKQLAGMDLMQRIEAINRHSTESYEQAEKCLRTNYHGIKAVTKALLPLLQSSSHGRIVNLSSYYGLLRVKMAIQCCNIDIYTKEKNSSERIADQ